MKVLIGKVRVCLMIWLLAYIVYQLLWADGAHTAQNKYTYSVDVSSETGEVYVHRNEDWHEEGNKVFKHLPMLILVLVTDLFLSFLLTHVDRGPWRITTSHTPEYTSKG